MDSLALDWSTVKANRIFFQVAKKYGREGFSKSFDRLAAWNERIGAEGTSTYFADVLETFRSLKPKDALVFRDKLHKLIDMIESQPDPDDEHLASAIRALLSINSSVEIMRAYGLLKSIGSQSLSLRGSVVKSLVRHTLAHEAKQTVQTMIGNAKDESTYRNIAELIGSCIFLLTEQGNTRVCDLIDFGNILLDVSEDHPECTLRVGAKPALNRVFVLAARSKERGVAERLQIMVQRRLSSGNDNVTPTPRSYACACEAWAKENEGFKNMADLLDTL